MREAVLARIVDTDTMAHSEFWESAGAVPFSLPPAYVPGGSKSSRVQLEPAAKDDAVIMRARELASQGRHPQTIEVLLRMEGFLDASDFISIDLAKELKQVADEARKRRDGQQS